MACALASLALVMQPSVSTSAEAGWKVESIQPWPSVVAPEAIVTEGTTDIKWIPQPFQFKAGSSVRYIDFASGDDAKTGDSKEAAWKHHPWDAMATGAAAANKGVHTYVFKGGVTYRGQLKGEESGTEAEPIRLTRDPSWGTGPAILAGSESVPAGSWKKIAPGDAKTAGLPPESAGKVWMAEIGKAFEPWALWTVSAEGKRERLNLARWPNWKIEHPYNHFTQWFKVDKAKAGFPRTTISADVLKGYDKDAFKGATIWVDHPNTSAEFTIMGPVSSSVGGYDPATGTLHPELNHPARAPAVKSPFFLENKAWFLDEAGEWYFDKESGRLYVWLAGDADPNRIAVEVAHHLITLELVGARHVEISGLTFNGGNSIDPKKAVDVGNYKIPENFALMSAIRLLGDCRSIHISNIAVTQTAGGGIANMVTSKDDLVSDIWITDSEFTYLDNDGICLYRGFSWRLAETQPKARLTDVHILRNKMYDIGRRGMSPSSAGKAIDLNGPEVCDVSGNVIEFVAAHGINVNGGRPVAGMMGGSAPETPLIRIQVRQNKVKDALLYKTDFGNIEFWQTGPCYIYGNISINPIGWIAHRGQYHKNEAFYFDHGLKGYLFNNIGWSDDLAEANKGIIGDTFYKDVRTHWNMMFQNTSMNFRNHYAHEGTAGDQQQIIGNLMLSTADIGGFISYWRLGEASEVAISRNLIWGRYENFYKRFRGDTFRTIGELQASLAGSEMFLAKDVGWVTDEKPVIDPAKRDFRLTDNSAAIDRGARVFVPWSLYGNVGEWYFRLMPKTPGEILSYDLYPQEFTSSFELLRLDGDMPDNRLVGEGFTEADYGPGVLEDWTEKSALRFDGSKTLVLPNKRLIEDFEIMPKVKKVRAGTKKEPEGEKKVPEGKKITGTDRRTVRMGTNNFSLEAVLLRDAAGKAGNLAAKTDGTTGYALGLTDEGKPRVTLQAGGQKLDFVGAAALTPGVWHHVLAEVDRAKGEVILHIDGSTEKATAAGAMFGSDVSLDNGADFVVGSGFVGALDFLRVSRGTLADAETTIDELMSWQFNGPAVHDFTGRAITGKRRDIGALEHPSATGEKAITYTPPKSEGKPDAAPSEKADSFLTGPDRTVKTTAWGTVSVPKKIAPGGKAMVQVAFPTETIPKEMIMQIDLHGMVGGQRQTGLGRSAPIKVQPGVTTPYSAEMTIPKTLGLQQVMFVITISPDGSRAKQIFSTEAASVVAP